MNSGQSYLDFNDASVQRENTTPVDRHNEKEEIKARLQGRIEEVLHHLLPAGKIRHGQFLIGDVDGNPGESMKVELTGEKAGVWYDHALGQGGDVFQLWARSRGLDTTTQFPQVMEDIQGWLGDHIRPLAPIPKPTSQRREPPMDELGPHTGKWDYFDANGQLLVCVYRYDPPGRRKEFRPLDVRTGKWQSPEVTPLYNLPGIVHATEVVLVEGEKTAQALIDAGIPATTSLGSKGQINRADWSPLQGKRIVIWPDRDKAGWEYAEAVSTAAKTAGAHEVSILMPPSEKPEKWDAADAIAEGMDVHAFLASAQRQTAPADTQLLPTFRLSELLADNSPMPSDLITPRLLTPGGILVIGGAPKVGKSDFLIHLLAHMAAGIEFLGFAPPRPMGVFYLQAEIQYHYLRERMKKMALPASLITTAGRNLVITPKVRMLLDDNGTQQTITTIQRDFPAPPPDIICIDPIRNVFDGGPDGNGENDNNAMMFFLQERVERIRDAVNPDAGVILSHHTRKLTKKQLLEDPFQALSGAGSLRSFYSSGVILYRTDEKHSERILQFELRNGPAVSPMAVDKIDGEWVEIDTRGERIVTQLQGERQDAERDRKRDVIIQLIFDEAQEGRVYTPAQFAEAFENNAGLGGRDNIGKRLSVASTKGQIKFFRDVEDYDLPPAPRSKFGYMCVNGMQLLLKNGQSIQVLPTHFKSPHTGAVLPVENPEVWVRQEEDAYAEE